MNILKSYPIVEASQVEVMRHIYNENLDSLATKALPYRTYEDQQQWWEGNKHVLSAFLYEPIDRPDVIVGFMVLRERGGFQTPIIALRKEEWGKGYGKEMVFDYIEKANGPMAGSQLKSNVAICHLNKNAGWQILGEREEPHGIVELLVHLRKSPQEQIAPRVHDAILEYLGITQSKIAIIQSTDSK